MKVTLSELNDKIAQLDRSAKEIRVVSTSMSPQIHDDLDSKITAQRPDAGDVSCILRNAAELLEDYGRMLRETTRSIEIDWPPKSRG